MNNYWREKKMMASGCEPLLATRMIAALQPYVWGVSLAGAGGGGFMYVFTKEPHATQVVAEVLASVQVRKQLVYPVYVLYTTHSYLTHD